MKLPVIKKATWEKLYYPEAKWVVVELEYNTYTPHRTLFKAIKQWFSNIWYEL